MIKSYKSNTLSVFKQNIQDGIAKVNNNATVSGLAVDEYDVYYTITEVNNEWLIILLAFNSPSEIPREFTITVPKNS